MICFWITIFTERWKRKQNELRLYWGTLVQTKEAEDKVRTDFQGNEEYSHSNYKVNRKDISSMGRVYTLINFLVVIFFISVSVSSFFLTNQYVPAEYAGMVNGVIIGSTNYAYKTIAEPLLKLENKKFEDEYNNSFIKKLFIFEFINANVSLISTIYSDKDMKKLNQIVLGTIGTKIFSLFSSRVVMKWLMYEFKKIMYFSACKDKAAEQSFNMKLHLN